MSDIITTFEADEENFVITHNQDEVQTLKRNAFERLHGTNKQKLFRKIASIPSTAVRLAEQAGYDMSNRNDVKLFLKRHPEYST